MSIRVRVLPAVAAVAVMAAGPMASAQGQAGQGQAGQTQTGRSSRPIVLTPPLGRGATADVEEVTVKADSVIGIRLETTLDSEHAKLEDRVIARVTRDVNVKGRTAIPAGALIEGYVSAITRKSDKASDKGPPAGKAGSDRGQSARIGLKFTTLVLNDGKLRLPIETETVFRSAESTTQTVARVGAGAVVGSILGAAIGGRKGALIGASAGAAGGAATAAAADRTDVTIPAGTTLTLRLVEPLTVVVERIPSSR